MLNKTSTTHPPISPCMCAICSCVNTNVCEEYLRNMTDIYFSSLDLSWYCIQTIHDQSWATPAWQWGEHWNLTTDNFLWSIYKQMLGGFMLVCIICDQCSHRSMIARGNGVHLWVNDDSSNLIILFLSHHRWIQHSINRWWMVHEVPGLYTDCFWGSKYPQKWPVTCEQSSPSFWGDVALVSNSTRNVLNFN